MTGVLAELVANSRRAIEDGVYDGVPQNKMSGADLVGSIRGARGAPVIAEVKFASPSQGTILSGADPADIARQMAEGGAVALSVLTQPHRFGGSPDALARVRAAVDIPILMKDIIVDRRQIDAGARMGADYVLLIESVFGPGRRAERDALIGAAHSHGMGVIVEAHSRAELESAAASGAEIAGINNRNLDTLDVDLGTTAAALGGARYDLPIVAESGISRPEDVRRLRAMGADAFLVGTSIMKSGNIGGAVRDLVGAL